MKHASSLLLAAGLAAAQSTTVVNILMPLADPQNLVASVVSADPTATQYFITCPSGTNSEDCGFPGGVSVLNGASTMTYLATVPYTISANCKLEPTKNLADCTGVLSSEGQSTTVTETMSDYSSYYLPVTVTAGVTKLSGNAGTTGGAATSNPTATSTQASTTAAPTSSNGGSASSGSSTGSSSGSSSGSSTKPSSSSSTGGMPRITQNAVMMGAAALVGGAMLI